MFKKLLGIVKNRAKVGAVTFLLDLMIGILTEWQRSSRDGNLDDSVNKKLNETNLYNNKNPFL